MTTVTDNDDAMAIAIPQVLKTAELKMSSLGFSQMKNFQTCLWTEILFQMTNKVWRISWASFFSTERVQNTVKQGEYAFS